MNNSLLLSFVGFLVLIQISAMAQPTISSFTPTSGPIGTSVTITGTNFNATAANNIVYFGAVKATVTLASTTSLTVTVPAGATYQPITVTTNGLTAYSRVPFIVTFVGGGFINSNSFDSKLDFTTSAVPNDLSICDIDSDGKSDLVLASTGNSGDGTTFSVLQNTSTTAGISFAPNVDFTTLAGPYAITTGDIDGDGKPDVVVINSVPTASISVFRNTSTSSISFASRQDFSVANNATKVMLQDIDMDGKPDLVVKTLFNVSIFLNTSTVGTISFAAASVIADSHEAVSDIDGDNKPDLIFINAGPSPNTREVTVARNTSTSGAISFATKIGFSVSPTVSYIRVLISDFDADGKPDIGVSNEDDQQISYFRNTSTAGSISMAPKIDVAISSFLGNLATADIDGDGKPDFSANDGNPNRISLRRNTTTGTTLSFASSVHPDNSLPSAKVFFGDLDSDGRPEIISIVSFSNKVSVYKNRMIPPTVSSFTPTSTGPGTTVTITGTNFTGATAVSFGGTAASSFNVVSSTSISAVVASGTSGNVSVTTPSGTGTKTGFTFIPAPTISSFTPVSVASGATVTITGTNLMGATAVSFGGTSATSFTVVSSTSITAVVGSGASGSVSVTTPGGTATKTGFTIVPAPTISSFTPVSVAGGATVAITGTNLTGATAVSFGGTAASSFTVVSATRITAVVASGASGSVSVTTLGGTATKAGFTFIPAPTISSFAPTSVASGATVTITGTNLSEATAVSFGGTAASSFTVVSATSITAVVANGASGSVSVTTPGGTATKAGFILTPVPTISSFTPISAAGGATVTITGTNFTGATAVSFGGTAASSFTVVSPTSITAVVGSGTSGSVSVTTPEGTAAKADFIFMPGLTISISSFTPTSAASGAIVMITGTNFTGATAVSFGGTAARSFTVVSSTSIKAVVAGGATGSVSVTTPNSTGSLAGFTFIPGVITAVVDVPNNGSVVDVKVFPNPTSGSEVNLEFDQSWEDKIATVAIMNISGQVVQTSSITCKSGTKLSIKNGRLSSGLYILTLQSGQKNARIRLNVIE